jgi:hypothetical protein
VLGYLLVTREGLSNFGLVVVFIFLNSSAKRIFELLMFEWFRIFRIQTLIDEVIRMIQNRLNNRSTMKLKFKSPEDVFHLSKHQVSCASYINLSILLCVE